MNMKTGLLMLFISLSQVLLAQDMAEKDVPAVVVSTFKEKFPDASETRWKKNKSGKYEADFRLSGKKAEAKFMADGAWDSSEKRLEASALPAAVTEYIKKNYASHKIDQVTFKEENTSSKNEYEVKLKKDKAETELTFDANGKFLKKKDKQKKDAA